MGRLYNRNYLKSRRVINHNPTTPESELWKSLKQKKLEGRKFHKKHNIGEYRLNFYCPSEKLAIEIDEEGNYFATERDVDKQKEDYLREQGIRIIRIKDDEVILKKENVLEKIKQEFSSVDHT